MHRGDDREPVLAPQLVDELEHLLLARRGPARSSARRAGRAGLLRQCAREHRALPLAAAERAERASAKPAGPAARARARRASRSRALSRRSSRRAACARAARSRARSCRRASRALRNHGDRRARSRRARPPRRRRRAHPPAVGTSPAIARSIVVLPAPFGPISADPLTRRRPQVNAVDDVAAAERAPTRPRGQIAVMRTTRLVRSTTAKNGAPKNAVTTPIGSSAGEIDGPREHVGEDEEARAGQQRERQQHAVARRRRAGGSRAGR